MQTDWIKLKRFIIPWVIMIGEKRFPLNMNHYRNAHYMVMNKAKIIFKNIMGPPCLPEQNKIMLKYTIVRKGKKRFDTMNIISVVDKFFSDYLCESGVVSDDNCDKVYYDRIEIIPGDDNYIICEIFTTE